MWVQLANLNLEFLKIGSLVSKNNPELKVLKIEEGKYISYEDIYVVKNISEPEFDEITLQLSNTPINYEGLRISSKKKLIEEAWFIEMK